VLPWAWVSLVHWGPAGFSSRGRAWFFRHVSSRPSRAPPWRRLGPAGAGAAMALGRIWMMRRPEARRWWDRRVGGVGALLPGPSRAVPAWRAPSRGMLRCSGKQGSDSTGLRRDVLGPGHGLQASRLVASSASSGPAPDGCKAGYRAREMCGFGCLPVGNKGKGGTPGGELLPTAVVRLGVRQGAPPGGTRVTPPLENRAGPRWGATRQSQCAGPTPHPTVRAFVRLKVQEQA